MEQYLGRFLDGQYVFAQQPILEEGQRFVLKVLDQPTGGGVSAGQIAQRLEELHEIMNALGAIEGETISDADIAEMDRNRLSFRRSFDF